MKIPPHQDSEKLILERRTAIAGKSRVAAEGEIRAEDLNVVVCDLFRNLVGLGTAARAARKNENRVTLRRIFDSSWESDYSRLRGSMSTSTEVSGISFASM